ncbi:EAL domain-containing protein [Thalassotalea atypica]|uniref:EAL domain-containing protein n=1 Tax=Thalassotalea atypica TaxID=2054316 RepID=UPI0025746C1B|nr:EAL domain-containing protein [Thalassotalea atypica]
MSEMAKQTNIAVVKRFDLFCVALYMFCLVVTLTLFWQQQNNDATILLISQNYQYASDQLIEVRSLETAQVLYAGPQKQIPLIRIIESSAAETSLIFVHPIWVLLTSPIFLSVTLIFSVLVFITRLLIYRSINNSLQQLSALEHWAYLSTIRGVIQPLPATGVIAKAVGSIVEQLQEAKRVHGKADQLIREQALLDHETGIGNREFFNNRLDALLCEEEPRGAVLLINFNGLEVIQSLYGNHASMTILESAIALIDRRMENLAHYFIARRDTFDVAILVPGIFIAETEKLATKLLRSLDALKYPVGINEEESCHIGVSCFSQQQQGYQIMAEADMALRSAQLQGPSQWFRYDSGEVVQESAKGSLKWRTYLTRAINKNAFVLFFQPVIANNSDEILHHEVLSKVRDEQGKLISARVFLPMAQKCGLASQVDMLVFEQVCRLIQYEQKQQEACSINMSVDSLLNEDFIERLFHKLASIPDAASKLIIEISEYHLAAHLNRLKSILEFLDELGLKILADKVGQYVVSADYLRESPVRYVKLHRSIVHHLHLRIENQVFIQSLNSICIENNVCIYALGVESKEEWLTLTQLGIKGGQGHYFTEPVAQMAQAIELP